MSCRELIDVLADYLDGALGEAAAAALEAHLADCPPCLAYMATYRATRALGAAAGRVKMPAEMKERLRRFLLERLHS